MARIQLFNIVDILFKEERMFNLKPIQFIKMLFSVAIILHTVEMIFSFGMICAGLFLSWLFYFNGGEYVAIMVMGSLSLIAGGTFAYRGLLGILKGGKVNGAY